MRIKTPLILAGVATALAAVTAVSAAERQPVHVMTVALPGGGVEQIRYTGDRPPRVVLGDAGAMPVAFVPFDAGFDEPSPFAVFDRIAAQMNAQADAMIRQVATMTAHAPAPGVRSAVLASAPAGAQSFQYVSTSTGNGSCMQSVSITSTGAGKAPQVVRKSTGDCGAPPATMATPAGLKATALPVAKKPVTIPRDSL